jgi:hypothetical protein
LIFGLALTCVAGAVLSLLLPRYPAEPDSAPGTPIPSTVAIPS